MGGGEGAGEGRRGGGKEEGVTGGGGEEKRNEERMRERGRKRGRSNRRGEGNHAHVLFRLREEEAGYEEGRGGEKSSRREDSY